MPKQGVLTAQDVSEIPGIKDTYWHVQRMVDMKGDRSHPEYIAASKLVDKTRGEILGFMADNKLDAVVGDLQLSLMASYSNSAHVSRPWSELSEAGWSS